MQRGRAHYCCRDFHQSPIELPRCTPTRLPAPERDGRERHIVLATEPLQALAAVLKEREQSVPLLRAALAQAERVNDFETPGFMSLTSKRA
jgi:hypothetical protein